MDANRRMKHFLDLQFFFDLVSQEGFYPKYILVYIHRELNKLVQL